MTAGNKGWFLEPRSNGSLEPRFFLHGNFLGHMNSSSLADRFAGTETVGRLNRDYRRIVLDMRGVQHMDGEGALSILQAYSRLKLQGCELALIRVPEQYRHKMEMHGLHKAGMSIEYIPVSQAS